MDSAFNSKVGYNKLLADHLYPLFENQGYKRVGSEFWRECRGSWSGFRFTPARHTLPSYFVFVCNIGVYSARILRFESCATSAVAHVKHRNPHFSTSLSLLVTGKPARYVINSPERIGELASDLREQLIVALPIVERLFDDRALCDALLGSLYHLMMPRARAIELALVLLREIGPPEQFETVLQELRRLVEAEAGRIPGVVEAVHMYEKRLRAHVV